MPGPVTQDEIDRVLEEYQLARRALRWVMEHRVYWSPRLQSLVEPTGIASAFPTTRPPADIEVFITALAREIDLEAESAS